MENVLQGEAQQITRVAVERAKAGCPVCIKLIFDRLCPVRKGRPLQGLARRQGEGSIETLLRAVLDGELTPEEGKDVVSLIESAARVATAHALADMRAQQLETLKHAAEQGTLPGGVMLVPVAGPDEWEVMAVNAQRQLKQRVRE